MSRFYVALCPNGVSIPLEIGMVVHDGRKLKRLVGIEEVEREDLKVALWWEDVLGTEQLP